MTREFYYFLFIKLILRNKKLTCNLIIFSLFKISVILNEACRSQCCCCNWFNCFFLMNLMPIKDIIEVQSELHLRYLNIYFHFFPLFYVILILFSTSEKSKRYKNLYLKEEIFQNRLAFFHHKKYNSSKKSTFRNAYWKNLIIYD